MDECLPVPYRPQDAATTGIGDPSPELKRLQEQWKVAFGNFCSARGVDVKVAATKDCAVVIESHENDDDTHIKLPIRLRVLITGIFGAGVFINNVHLQEDNASFVINVDSTPYPVVDNLEDGKRVIRSAPDGETIAVGNRMDFDFKTGQYFLTLGSLNSPHQSLESMQEHDAVYTGLQLPTDVFAEFISLLRLLDERDNTRISVYRPYRGLSPKDVDFP